MQVQVRNLSPHPLPSYATPDSAGLDLRAWLPSPLTLAPAERALIGTGLYLALPPGYEGQIRPRSGNALKFGLTVLNSPGTVDADYRGEVKVLIINLGQTEHTIQDGDRIAQLVVAPVTQITWAPTETLSKTQRGEGGYGSTGT